MGGREPVAGGRAIQAQWAEHRIRNAGVRGSIPRDGSRLPRRARALPHALIGHCAGMRPPTLADGPRKVPMILYSLRFLRVASRGYRLCPWQSPYLRWRIET